MKRKVQRSIQDLRAEAFRALDQEWQPASKIMDALRTFNKTPGVYLVKKKSTKAIIYVGMSSNLRSRIWNGHLSSASRGRQMSQFRQLVNRRYPAAGEGPKMRDWLAKNCLFSVMPTKDEDSANMVEMLLIHALRSKHLMNKGMPAQLHPKKVP